MGKRIVVMEIEEFWEASNLTIAIIGGGACNKESTLIKINRR